MWNILNPFKPWLGGGWGYGGLWGRGGWYGNGWNYGGSYWRDRGLRPAGGFGGGDLINKLPGQLARPSTRPAIIDNVVRCERALFVCACCCPLLSAAMMMCMAACFRHWPRRSFPMLKS